MRGKGLGRFMLHFLQILSFCRNDTFELHLKSSKESVQFYKECNFFKGNVKRSTYKELESMRCESVITLKQDDNMRRYYLKNWHENPNKSSKKELLT